MKKLLGMILVLGLLLNGNAYSNWIESSKSNNGTLYYNPETLTKNEKTSFIWTLIDHKEIKDRGKSRKIHLEVNCINRKFKMHYMTIYKDQLGQGDIVEGFSISEESEWTSAIPGSTLYPVIKVICN
ncbi:hypothetical protein N9N60_03005 [Candidatus Pelagibacter bacterium]|nr:surface-adhesin E family protein [Candidatus Pelagibacter bacterium]MDA8845673.1 hypothetical protein [Candidatus Pelagibacter bacterium]